MQTWGLYLKNVCQKYLFEKRQDRIPDLSVGWHRNSWLSTCVGRNFSAWCIFCEWPLTFNTISLSIFSFSPSPLQTACGANGAKTSMSAGKRADANCLRGEATCCCVSLSSSPLSFHLLPGYNYCGSLRFVSGEPPGGKRQVVIMVPAHSVCEREWVSEWVKALRVKCDTSACVQRWEVTKYQYFVTVLKQVFPFVFTLL